MAEDYHKPTLFDGSRFDYFQGGEDPAAVSRVAHETAQAIMARVRGTDDPDVVKRLVHYTDEHGIDAIAELWARSPADSLPGALWRIYLIRVMIRRDAPVVSFLFQRGAEVLRTIDPLVAGAPEPAGPEEVKDLADEILRGVFAGDFAVALDRAAAFSRVVASGATAVADDLEGSEPERATGLTTRALRLTRMAGEFATAARLWRATQLD